jgi:hypothetical protein
MKKLTLVLSIMIALVGLNANAAIYIVGDGPLGGWTYNGGNEMFDQGNGNYTYSMTIAEDAASATVYFVFADGQGTDWSDFNDNFRIGPDSGNQEVTAGTWINTQRAYGDHGAYFFQGTKGQTYTISFDASNNQFKVDGYVEPIVIAVRGDVDGDNNVNISDVTALTDLLLKNQTAPATADCNLDGSVGIGDVTALIDYLLKGSWPVPEMVYTIAGVESVFGSNWDPTDENNNMVKGADGVYTWSKTGVALTDNFEFKVVGNHDWSVYEWPMGMNNNYVAEVAEEGMYDIVITFDPEAEEADRITCTMTKTGNIEHVYTVVGTYNLFGEDWDPYFEPNNMVKGDDGIYRLTKEGWFQEGTEIFFKVVQDHSYTHSWPAENFQIGVYKTGAFSYEIVFNPYNNDEDKVHVIITEIF